MKIILRCLLIITCLSATTAFSDTPTDYYYYGAIAFSQSTGYTGGAWDYSTEREAAYAAERSCGRSDCRAVMIFWNQCGAIAIGERGGWGGGYGSEMNYARSAALDTCRKYGNTNCQIAYSVCTTR